MVITVVGGGFVGIVSAICLCEFGFRVWVCDEDSDRLDQLKKNVSPSDEPGIGQALTKHSASGQLTFSRDIHDLARESDVVVVAVSTLKANNDADMSDLHSVMRKITISLSNTHHTAVVIKTNIPIGAGSIIANNARFLRTDIKLGEHYDIITNPGILREGSAIQDFMEPDVVLVGTSGDSDSAKNSMMKLYAPIAASAVPFVVASYETVEIIRSGAIGFSAVVMAYANEIADVCSRCGADLNIAIKGIVSNSGGRLKGFEVSPGFGGTSYPRTVRGLSDSAKSLGANMSIIDAAIESNKLRIASIKPRIMKLLGNADVETPSAETRKKVAILGLS
ncbi:MAG: nucleotide sugar dehydrogenase, partial [Holosporales bacterium]|nr:nucleotide sugar dehydrogenase [Holosporales bacterium]